MKETSCQAETLICLKPGTGNNKNFQFEYSDGSITKKIFNEGKFIRSFYIDKAVCYSSRVLGVIQLYLDENRQTLIKKVKCKQLFKVPHKVDEFSNFR